MLLLKCTILQYLILETVIQLETLINRDIESKSKFLIVRPPPLLIK